MRFVLVPLLLGSVATASGRFTDISLDAAVQYLKEYRPYEDGVSDEVLQENARLALATRSLPFAAAIPPELFLSQVLPYAHFDEPRDNWRPRFYTVFAPLVAQKQTLKEAAEALFPAWSQTVDGKHLQFQSNMTPQVMAPVTETLVKGYASCTGMSIFLADALRSAGIPARIVGTSEWNRPEGGNHNWVEVWTGSSWDFVDAVPSNGHVEWNRTWFVEQAAQQESMPITHAILSPMWGPQAQTVYNLTWRGKDAGFVPAIDVTANYRVHSGSPGAMWMSLQRHPIGAILFVAVVSLLLVKGASIARHVSKEWRGYERLA